MESLTQGKWPNHTRATFHGLWQTASRDPSATHWPTEADECTTWMNSVSGGRRVLVNSLGKDRSLYNNWELQLQTDFKSDRKLVRVCVEEEKKKKKLVYSYNPLGVVIIFSQEVNRKWSLMLRPFDALQIDAFLNHLPQRADREKQTDMLFTIYQQ